MPVTVEVECHDPSGLTLPYPYKEEKYTEYKKRLESAMTSQLGDHQIDVAWLVNPVHRGMAGVEGMQNWYWQKREGAACKVRYPRAGAFEVTVRCPADFAPASSGLPEQLEVWSKLRTHRWPDPEKLAEVVARVLARGRDREDVSAAIQRIRQQCEGPTRPDGAKRSAASTAIVPMKIGTVPLPPRAASAPQQAPGSPTLRRTAPAAAAQSKAAAQPRNTAAAQPSGTAGQARAPSAPGQVKRAGQGARTASAPQARGPEARPAQPAAAQPRPPAARQAATPQPTPAAPAAAAPAPAPAAVPATAAPAMASPAPASPAATTPAPSPAAPGSVEQRTPERAPGPAVGVGVGAAVGSASPLLDEDLGGGDASDHEVMEAASRHLDAAPGEDDYPDDFEDTLQRPLTGGSPSAAPAAPPSAPEAPSPPARPASASPADDYEDDFEQTLQGEPEVQVTDSFLLLKEVEQMQTQKDQAATPQPQGEPSPVEQPQGELSPVGRYDETEDFELESDEDDDDDDDDELLDVADSKPAALQEFRSSDSIDLVTDGEDGGGGAAAYSREDEFEDDSVESLS